MIILVLRDENEITYCYSHVSRRDRDLRILFLMAEQKNQGGSHENSRDYLRSGLGWMDEMDGYQRSADSTFGANKKRSFNLRAP